MMFQHVPCNIYIYTYSVITYSNNTPIPITIPIELSYSNDFPTIFYQCFNNIIVSWYSTQIPNIFQDDSRWIIVWTVMVGLIFSHNSCLDSWHMPIAIYWASLCCAFVPRQCFDNITIIYIYIPFICQPFSKIRFTFFGWVWYVKSVKYFLVYIYDKYSKKTI